MITQPVTNIVAKAGDVSFSYDMHTHHRHSNNGERRIHGISLTNCSPRLNTAMFMSTVCHCRRRAFNKYTVSGNLQDKNKINTINIVGMSTKNANAL